MDLISSIKSIDTELFLYLNSKHNAFFDFIMFWASNRFTWIPLYIYFAFLVYKKTGKEVWLVLLSAILLILLSDQISNHLFKTVFLRYRPCHNLIIQSRVYVNGGCGGTYGFISSHATNTFALAMFLALFFRNHIKYFGVFIFLWASFVSYSRIYNGVHYPADIAVGAIVGMITGYFVFRWYRYVHLKIEVNQHGK